AALDVGSAGNHGVGADPRESPAGLALRGQQLVAGDLDAALDRDVRLRALRPDLPLPARVRSGRAPADEVGGVRHRYVVERAHPLVYVARPLSDGLPAARAAQPGHR